MYGGIVDKGRERKKLVGTRKWFSVQFNLLRDPSALLFKPQHQLVTLC